MIFNEINHIHDKSNTLISNHIVYHYTSPNAFLNIIKSKKMRFTDIRYMNDRSERVFFVKLLIDFFDSNPNKYPYCENAFKIIISENDQDEIKKLKTNDVKLSFFPHPDLPDNKSRTFIWCASENKDSLGMWNYYVQGNSYQGYNIGIDIAEFLKTFNKTTSSSSQIEVNYGNILYDEHQQIKSIDKHLYDIEKSINEIISSGGETEYCNIREMLQYINIFSCFFKDSHYSDEKEFRIIIQFNDAENIFENDFICEDFCVKNGLIVPYINVNIPEHSIKEVTISPIIESRIAKFSITELLKQNKYDDVPISQSNIPVRF